MKTIENVREITEAMYLLGPGLFHWEYTRDYQHPSTCEKGSWTAWFLSSPKQYSETQIYKPYFSYCFTTFKFNSKVLFCFRSLHSYRKKGRFLDGNENKWNCFNFTFGKRNLFDAYLLLFGTGLVRDDLVLLTAINISEIVITLLQNNHGNKCYIYQNNHCILCIPFQKKYKTIKHVFGYVQVNTRSQGLYPMSCASMVWYT